MNNKGFTLVEILSVIVLIGLLMGIGIPGISRISQNMKQKSLNTKINLVEEAGVFWGQDNKSMLQSDNNCKTEDGDVPCKKISIKELIEDDYLDSETYSSIVYDNPVSGDTMLNNCVYIYKKNNRVHSFYSKNDTSCINVTGGETPEVEKNGFTSVDYSGPNLFNYPGDEFSPSIKNINEYAFTQYMKCYSDEGGWCDSEGYCTGNIRRCYITEPELELVGNSYKYSGSSNTEYGIEYIYEKYERYILTSNADDDNGNMRFSTDTIYNYIGEVSDLEVSEIGPTQDGSWVHH